MTFWLLLKEGMFKMVMSYKKLFDILKEDFDLRKVDFIRDLPEIFPLLKKRMTRSNYTIKQLSGFLRGLDFNLNQIEKEIRRYYQGKKKGIAQENWLLPSLKTWLTSEMQQKNPPFRDLQVFSKIRMCYPGETEGIEMDVLGVGILERKKRQSKYEFWAIEAKIDNKSFYKKIRQTIGYPIFIDKLFFAAYFLKNKNYSVEQRAFARRRGLQLLRLTSSRMPIPKTRFTVEKVPLRGGKDEPYLRENFGQKVLKSNKNGAVIPL